MTKGNVRREVHPDPAMDENREGHGLEESGNRRYTEKGYRNCPTSLLKTWRLHDHPQTTI